MARTTFSGPVHSTAGFVGDITGDITGDLTGSVTGGATGPWLLEEYDVAGQPDATLYEGAVIYVSDGDAGSPCIAVSNGTDWLRIALGAAIADS